MGTNANPFSPRNINTMSEPNDPTFENEPQLKSDPVCRLVEPIIFDAPIAKIPPSINTKIPIKGIVIIAKLSILIIQIAPIEAIDIKKSVPAFCKIFLKYWIEQGSWTTPLLDRCCIVYPRASPENTIKIEKKSLIMNFSHNAKYYGIFE